MPDRLYDRLQVSLGAAYALERELGGGGMARVFVARDLALDRQVVVKVLSPELAQGLSAERFAREIKLAAALQNPHIVPLLAAGTTADGVPYYTMPYVEGESLRVRLAARPMPLDEARRILCDLAEALEYAHAHGVVHRDIKPDNVLLSGRAAVVADFGIAKAIRAARDAESGAGETDAPNTGTLTSVGTSLGTPAYMAPEQAVGDTADHRADLYAWGIVAYEMLAGRHPFAHRTTAQQLVVAHLAEAPAPLDDVRPGLPPTLGALVMHCLAKDPADRPRDAAEVLAALASLSSGVSPYGTLPSVTLPTGAVPVAPVPSGGVSGGVGDGAAPATRPPASRRRVVGAGVALTLVALLAAAGLAWRARSSGAAPNATPSLAVLPFEHQGDSADAYLTDGITDEIRGKLTGVRDLIVIARGSSVPYRATKKTPREIARELGVRYLLTGTVRVGGTGDARHVLVRPELVEITESDQPQSRCCQQPIDASVTDVVRVQGAIAQQVVGAMEVALGGTERARLARVATRDPAAYDLYLRGMAAVSGGAASDAGSVRRAIGFFDQAVARDSTALEAWVMIARGSSLLYLNATPSPDVARRAREAVDRVAALAPDGAERHVVRGGYLRSVERNLTGALDEYLVARRLDPRNTTTLRALALLEADLGRFDDALRDYDAALRLDPLAASAYAGRAHLLVRMRRLAEARTSVARARALAPTSLTAVEDQLTIEVAAGDLPAARRVVADAARDIPRERLLPYIATYGDYGWVLDDADQRALLDLGEDAFDDREAMTTVRAQLYRWRGDTSRARTWGDSASAAVREVLREEPRDGQRRVLLGLMRAYAGRTQATLDTVAHGLALLDERPERRMSRTNVYYYYVAARAARAAGDHERALAWLRVALERRHVATPASIRLEPSWAPLRSDPRFEQLLAEFAR